MVICLLLAPSLYVRADVLIEPANNFYKKNADKCVYLNRSFRVNGENGNASIKRAPDSMVNIASFENGKIVYVEYSCLYDGEFWGLATYVSESGNGKTGWVEMEQLLVLYDYVAFEEEHYDEFYQYAGDFTAIKETGSVIVWTWPGSGNSPWTVNDLNVESFQISYAFKDEDGREWGFIPYLYGSRNLWICISDPVNRDIPAFNPAPKPVKWETDTNHIEIEKTDNIMIIFIVVLISILVASTATLIKVFWKQQKENTQRED
jgi:hypothetical protein